MTQYKIFLLIQDKNLKIPVSATNWYIQITKITNIFKRNIIQYIP